MLIALASAKGSPGVTTAARVLASVWPSDVVLADCDPAGGDMALVGRAPGGAVLDPDRGLLSLAAQARRGLPDDVLDGHLQTLEGGLGVLCGVATPEQASGIAPVWPVLAAALRAPESVDVIADCGRLTSGTAVMPLVGGADVLVLVVRPLLEAYAHLRERLLWWAQTHRASTTGPAVGVVVLTDARDHRSPEELARLLVRSGLDVPVIGRLAHDQRAADVVAGRVERGIDRSLLVRSARELVDPVRALGIGRGSARINV